MSVRITCIKKDGGNHQNPYVAISSLGWINDGDNKIGESTREAMYTFVKDGGVAYVVGAGNSKAYLTAEEKPSGTRYVKTVPDDTKSDNLLQLKECGK